MLTFNLEHYKCFYYVAKLGSITKAAEALFISQPAASRSIQHLEENLGILLFQRKSHGMELTADGRALFTHVEAAFEHLISGEKELTRSAETRKATIRIAATETPLYQLLLPKIEGFQQDHPNVYFQISGGSSEETISLLRNNRADFVLAVSPLENAPDLQILEGPFFRDILVAGPAFSHLAKDGLTAERLSAQPVIAVKKGTSARRHLDTWFQRQGCLFSPTVSVQTSSMILPCVLQNLGIGILPESFAAEALKQGQVIKISQDVPFPPRRICIILLRQSGISELCNNFLTHLLGADPLCNFP